jgi:hypothetical protein
MRSLLLVILALVALPASATYTKIANNGAELPDSTSLGSATTDWACTRDNATGLIWEVKTSSGLRNQSNTYTNYDSSYGTPTQIADPANSQGFVAAVNTASLCGYGEWRLPSKDELLGLVNLTATPSINATYFPNTPGALFWTASPLAGNAANAVDIDFSNGAVYNDARSLYNHVRLVRSVPTSALALTVSVSGAGSGSVNSGGIACTNNAGSTSGTCTAQRGSGSSVTLSATPSGNSAFAGWSGACSGTTPTCTVTMDAAKEVSAAFVVKYYKIANNGSDLPESALLGSAPDDWGCTRDNTTGLIWEVKNADGGLRDLNKTYTNYDDTTQAQKWNGSTYVNPTQAEIDAASNSLGLAKTVNNSGLCGYGDWHRPSVYELLGILDWSYSPTINPTYFPNTPSSYFWSGSPNANNSDYAWGVYFSYGYVDGYGRNDDGQVRLVRGGQSFGTFALSVSASGAGSGSVNTGGINCQRAGGATSGTCSAEHGSGSSVILTATPAPGSLFTAWGGACSGSTPTCTVTMEAAKSVSAQFDAGPLANGACGLSDGQTLSVAPTTRLCTAGTASRITASLPRTWRWSCSGYNGGTPAACSATSSVDLFTLTVRKSGNGSVVSTPAGIDCGSDCGETYTKGSSVTLTATPAAGSSFAAWGGACAGNTGLSCSLTMNASKSVTVNTATFTTYTKVANNGSDLADSAPLGSGATDWACTRANSSGLLWEVKTADGGLRDKNKSYTNYDGSYGTAAQIAAASNSLGFAAAVNSSALCGFSDWRMPGVDELVGLVDKSSTPTINPTYFPNTPSSGFWSGSPYAYGSSYAWGVYFDDGNVSGNDRYYGVQVRLVRGGQSFGTLGLRLSATGSGSGTLSADDGSVHCARAAGYTSGVCYTSLFNGTTVTLTATPASGSGFAGWGGACSASTGPTCSVTMDAAKSVTAGFNSGAASQTIAFDPAPSVSPGGTATLRATASSGLVVSLASSTTEICRVSGFTLTGVAAGLCTLTANQTGNASFSPAPQVTQSFSIAAAPPGPPTNVVITPGSGSATIRFSPPANDGGASINNYTATCTASGKPPRSTTGSASPLTVRNLAGNVLYQCTLTASNSAGLTSTASAATPVTPAPAKNSLTPILMLLLD